MKSVCIKTVSEEKIEYLIEQFEKIPMNIYISNYRFKTFDNLIIHYTEKEYIDEFYEVVSLIIKNCIEKFFEDIATSSGLFHCLLQKNERSQDTPAFRKVQVFYYPNRVDSIIADSIKKKKCSIVFTGKRIAGKDSEYSSLSEECGIEELGKPVVKEYILK